MIPLPISKNCIKMKKFIYAKSINPIKLKSIIEEGKTLERKNLEAVIILNSNLNAFVI